VLSRVIQIKAIYIPIWKYVSGAFQTGGFVMLRLASMLYSLIGTTLAGSAVVVALVIGQDTLQPIVTAAVLGFILALPVTYVVAKKIYSA